MDGGIVPVRHVCGASPWYHINADALSRIPDPLAYCPNYRAGTRLSRLPCYSQLNPCKFCTRAEATWIFEDDVNYVVQLTVRKIEVKQSDRDSASDHRNSLGDQEVHEQLRQFHQMLKGLEPRLDHRQQDSSQLRPPVAAPPGFAALPLAASRPYPVVRAPVLPPAPASSGVLSAAPCALHYGSGSGTARGRCQWSCCHCHTECPCSLRRGSCWAIGLHFSGVAFWYRDCGPSWAATGPPGEGVPSSEPDGVCSYPVSRENFRAARACSSEDFLTRTAWQPGWMATNALPH